MTTVVTAVYDEPVTLTFVFDDGDVRYTDVIEQQVLPGGGVRLTTSAGRQHAVVPGWLWTFEGEDRNR